MKNIDNKKPKNKKNRYFRSIKDYKLNSTGRILFSRGKIYKFKKYSRYLFKGKNDKGNEIILSSDFMKRNFEEVKGIKNYA